MCIAVAEVAPPAERGIVAEPIFGLPVESRTRKIAGSIICSRPFR